MLVIWSLVQFLSCAFVLLVCLALRMNNGGLACLELILFGKFCLIILRDCRMGGNISVGWFGHRTYMLILPSFNEGLV